MSTTIASRIFTNDTMSGWLCASCTFANHEDLTECEVCEAQRPDADPVDADDSDSASDAEESEGSGGGTADGGRADIDLSGCCFLLTGTLTVSRAAMETEIEGHGGSVGGGSPKPLTFSAGIRVSEPRSTPRR